MNLHFKLPLIITTSLILFTIVSAVSSQQASENELQTTPPPQPNSNSSLTSKPEPKQHISEEDFNKIGKILKVNEKKLPVLKKIGRKINSLIDRVHANGHVLRPELVVHEFLPDPLKVKDIEVDEDGWTSSYKGRFTGVLLHGTSGVKINSIKANVGTLSAKVMILGINQVLIMIKIKIKFKCTYFILFMFLTCRLSSKCRTST